MRLRVAFALSTALAAPAFAATPEEVTKTYADIALAGYQESLATRALFDELIADEEGRTDYLETELSLFDTLGAEKYGLLNAKPASQAE